MKKGTFLKQAALGAAIVCTLYACTKTNESVPVTPAGNGTIEANSIIGTNGISGGANGISGGASNGISGGANGISGGAR